jgi:hypothetical protein
LHTEQRRSDDIGISSCAGGFGIEVQRIQVLQGFRELANSLSRDGDHTNGKFFANQIGIKFDHAIVLSTLWNLEPVRVTLNLEASLPSVNPPFGCAIAAPFAKGDEKIT